MNNLFINPEVLKKIIAIVEATYPKSMVLAYGSRVNGSAHSGSDLDLVVKDFGEENGSINTLKHAFGDSDIPFFVDVLEFDSVPESFQREIEKQHIIIYNGNKK